jgi:hypothetical protein
MTSISSQKWCFIDYRRKSEKSFENLTHLSQIEVMVVGNESEIEPSEPSKVGSASPIKSRYYQIEKRYSDFLTLHNDVRENDAIFVPFCQPHITSSTTLSTWHYVKRHFVNYLISKVEPLKLSGEARESKLKFKKRFAREKNIISPLLQHS